MQEVFVSIISIKSQISVRSVSDLRNVLYISIVHDVLDDCVYRMSLMSLISVMFWICLKALDVCDVLDDCTSKYIISLMTVEQWVCDTRDAVMSMLSVISDAPDVPYVCDAYDV
jgi:hypothetical protein